MSSTASWAAARWDLIAETWASAHTGAGSELALEQQRLLEHDRPRAEDRLIDPDVPRTTFGSSDSKRTKRPPGFVTRRFERFHALPEADPLLTVEDLGKIMGGNAPRDLPLQT